MKGRFIVTIDGPAASGKSTLAELLAQRDAFLHIDTGALYRTIGYVCGKHPTQEAIDTMDISVKIRDNRIVIEYKNKDVETFIRTERCGMLASVVAKLDFVRNFVNNKTREIAKNGKYVIDGRDCGTVIFPDADLKIFLTANPKERAKRRAKDDNKDEREIEKEIERRDKQDMNRSNAPLSKPEDAIEIDTTRLTIEEMYDIVKKLIEDKL